CCCESATTTVEAAVEMADVEVVSSAMYLIFAMDQKPASASVCGGANGELLLDSAAELCIRGYVCVCRCVESERERERKGMKFKGRNIHHNGCSIHHPSITV